MERWRVRNFRLSLGLVQVCTGLISVQSWFTHGLVLVQFSSSQSWFSPNLPRFCPSLILVWSWFIPCLVFDLVLIQYCSLVLVLVFSLGLVIFQSWYSPGLVLDCCCFCPVFIFLKIFLKRIVTFPSSEIDRFILLKSWMFSDRRREMERWRVRVLKKQKNKHN